MNDGFIEARHRRIMLGALIVAELAGTYETAMIYAALPTLVREFNDVVGVSWLITIYLLAGAMFAVLSSRLGDIFGRTRMLLIVLGLIVAGSLISTFATSLLLINVGRALQGAAAAILPLSFGIVRETVPPEKTSMIVGILTGAASVGAGVGLIVGALLVDNFHWKSIFVVSALLGALAFVAVLVGVPRRQAVIARVRDLDLIGGVLFAPALCGLLLVLANGTKWGVFAPITLFLFIASVTTLTIWVRHELRHPNPLIDVRLLARREIALTNLIMAFAGVGAYQITQLLTLLLQQPSWTVVGLGLSATVVGLIKLPANLCGLLGSLLSGQIAMRWSAKHAAALGTILVAAGWLYMTFFHGSLVEVAIGLFVASFALPILIAAASNTIIAAAPMDRISEATGLSAVIRTAVSAVGSQLIALTLAASAVAGGSGGRSYPSPEAYFATFGWITICCFVAAGLVWLLPSAPKRAVLAAAE